MLATWCWHLLCSEAGLQGLEKEQTGFGSRIRVKQAGNEQEVPLPSSLPPPMPPSGRAYWELGGKAEMRFAEF